MKIFRPDGNWVWISATEFIGGVFCAMDASIREIPDICRFECTREERQAMDREALKYKCLIRNVLVPEDVEKFETSYRGIPIVVGDET